MLRMPDRAVNRRWRDKHLTAPAWPDRLAPANRFDNAAQEERG
jgi:hypothetical protein